MIEQRIVIDTNCFVSRLLTPKSINSQAVRYAFDFHQILVSADTLTELEIVLSRKKFNNYASLEERQKFILYLKNLAEIVDITNHVQVCRDPKDDKFLSLAIAGNANIIITGDEDLLVLKCYQNIPILSPKDFLAQVDKS
ncbi:MAG: putative toxin-antitoxin system toxin component, PIN family [Dolichospermum sp.]